MISAAMVVAHSSAWGSHWPSPMCVFFVDCICDQDSARHAVSLPLFSSGARWNAERQAMEFGVGIVDRDLCKDIGSGCELFSSRERGPDEHGGIGHDLVGCTARGMRGFVARRRQRRTKPRRRLLWSAEYRYWAYQPLGAPAQGGGAGIESIAQRKLHRHHLTEDWNVEISGRDRR